MKIRLCIECGGEFKVYPSTEARAKYCSRRCRLEYEHKHRTTGKIAKAVCEACGVDFLAFTNSKKRFCSQDCKKAFLVGENSPRYKDGTGGQGYVVRMVGGKVAKDHRRIMEAYLGRPLGRYEFIHHINGDKTDNRIGNLQVMSPSDHAVLHNDLRRMGIPLESAVIAA